MLPSYSRSIGSRLTVVEGGILVEQSSISVGFRGRGWGLGKEPDRKNWGDSRYDASKPEEREARG